MTTQKDTLALAAHSLMAMALALPGIRAAKAETPVTRPKFDSRYTRFDEGRKRYQIDVYQGLLEIPLATKMDLAVDVKREVMAGASSMYYQPSALDAGGGPVSTLSEVRSKPSIYDTRSTGAIKVRHFGEDYNVSVGGRLSEEHDYESRTISTQYQQAFNKQNTNFTVGYSLSHDAVKATLYPVALSTSRERQRRAKISHTVGIGLKQDLSQTSLIQANVEFMANKGYLDDPYKQVFIWGNAPLPNTRHANLTIAGVANPYTIAFDHRPNYRGTLATSLGLIHHIAPANASLHITYRFAKNTWDIRSHTLSAEYYQPLGDAWEIVPALRYYTQNEAYFYAMTFDYRGNAPFAAKAFGLQDVASSDYRLARFGSLTAELKVSCKFRADQSGKFTAALGTIDRRNSLYWGRNPTPANPTNDFRTYYMSVGVRFAF